MEILIRLAGFGWNLNGLLEVNHISTPHPLWSDLTGSPRQPLSKSGIQHAEFIERSLPRQNFRSIVCQCIIRKPNFFDVSSCMLQYNLSPLSTYARVPCTSCPTTVCVSRHRCSSVRRPSADLESHGKPLCFTSIHIITIFVKIKYHILREQIDVLWMVFAANI
jgi:hypothetical protein